MKKEKQIINSVEDFFIASDNKGYSIKKVGDYANAPFSICKENVCLFVKWRAKKSISYRRPNYIGLVISKPSELLTKYDRSNSGQIIINFGKSDVEAIFEKISEMMLEYVKRLIAITEKQSSDDVLIKEIETIMERFQIFNPRRDTTKGFYISNFPELNNLGCDELYYSHSHGKFMLTERSLPYGGNVHSYNRIIVDLDKFNAYVSAVNQIQNQINLLNEKYFGQ